MNTPPEAPTFAAASPGVHTWIAWLNGEYPGAHLTAAGLPVRWPETYDAALFVLESQ
jgi:hypothetical protein